MSTKTIHLNSTGTRISQDPEETKTEKPSLKMTSKETRTARSEQAPEKGQHVYVPKSILPYIRSTLNWVGVAVSYTRSTGVKPTKCVGRVLDVRLMKNGSTSMLVNCWEHEQHKPTWKHSRGLGYATDGREPVNCP